MDFLHLIDFDRYTIYKDGRIWSKYFKKYLTGSKLNEYTKINLTLKNGKKKDFLRHRVIAFHFCAIPDSLKDKPLSKLEVDHIIPISEGGTDDASNLRWTDSKGNSNNPITLKKNKAAQPKKPVKAISINTNELIGVFESTNEAARILGINQGSIYNCASGRCKTYKGYTFEFV